MRFGPTLLAAALAAAPTAYAPIAQAQTNPRAGMNMGAPGGGMMDSMNRMNQGMASAPMTGDPDQDFVAMMIPHHQGAIDMAQYELAHGKDPVLRKLAQSIVTAQDKEIAQMRRWSLDHPSK